MAGMTFDPKAYGPTMKDIEPTHRDVIHSEITLPLNLPIEHVVEQRNTDICGLTKHEYMALELTKAWASTRAQGHETKEEIIETYVWLMNEVEKRNL